MGMSKEAHGGRLVLKRILSVVWVMHITPIFRLAERRVDIRRDTHWGSASLATDYPGPWSRLGVDSLSGGTEGSALK
jgi:hypothetical protein